MNIYVFVLIGKENCEKNHGEKCVKLYSEKYVKI